MRLTLKLALVFILTNIALAGIYGYLAVRREVVLFQKRAAAEAEEMGPVIEKLLADAWRTEGDRGMRESFHRIIGSQQQPLRIRWVWFDTKAEAEFCPAAAADRLTAIVIQEHIAVEADEPDGGSLLPFLLEHNRIKFRASEEREHDRPDPGQELDPGLIRAEHGRSDHRADDQLSDRADDDFG